MANLLDDCLSRDSLHNTSLARLEDVNLHRVNRVNRPLRLQRSL